MNEVLIVVISILVVAGGAALVYFLLKRLFKEEQVKPEKNKKTEKKAPEEKKAEAAPKVDEKAAKAAEKRKAEMMKRVEVKADPKVLENRFIKKAVEEITKLPESIETVTVKTNRIDWTRKEEYSQYPSGNVFFDDPTFSRLETAEMKLVAEHIFAQLRSKGYEMEEIGSGEKGTFRYHVDMYVIKAL